MMLTVHGLPFKTKFQDVKALIKQECNIPDFILDNLVEDGYDSKKVRIGLTNESDGYRLMKCLEGFRMSGSHVLRVVPVGKAPSQPQPTFETRSNYSNQPRNDYPNTTHSYGNQNDYNRPNTVNPPRHTSPHSIRTIGDTRLNDRERQPLPQDSRDYYQGSGDRRDNQEARSDFRDSSRGPLAPPTLRPASLNARVHGIDSRHVSSEGGRGTERSNVRGQDGLSIRSDLMRGSDVSAIHSSERLGMRASEQAMRTDVGIRGSDVPYQKPDHRQLSNPELNRQTPWTPAVADQWSNPTRPALAQNQNTGYSYQQQQGNVAYGQQAASALESFSANRAPQPQIYQQQQKPALAAERQPAPGRAHVLRSVELVDAPIQPRAPTNYPHMQKPITIMKDNFQGPTQYNITGQVPPTYQGKVTPQPWVQQQTPQAKPQSYDKSYDDRHPTDKLSKAQDYDKRRFSPQRTGSPGRRSPPRAIQSTNRSQAYSDRRISPSRSFNRQSPGRHPSTRFSPRRDVSPSKVSPRRNSPGRRISPRRHVSPGRRISPFARKISPSKDSGRHSPFARKVSPGRISPFGRKASPGGQRRVSPFGRKPSPSGQRRNSPFGRKVSPSGGQRRISPFGRKVSPPGRRVSPTRRVSPKREDLRRTSPSMTKYDYYVEDERRMGGRLVSPPRRYSPKRSPPRGSGRYSPSQTNYGHGADKDAKTMLVGAAYEAKQAQKYSGAGFRPNETQYPASARIESKPSPWQAEKLVYPLKEEARPNPLEEARKKLSPTRSRSRSPIKDRYRRHSPSPRSPRRSWALEKQRSPEPLPPPPPLWPGQEDKKPKQPVWERNVVTERFDDKRRNEDKFTAHTPRFSPRRDVDDYANKFDDYEEGRYRKTPRDEKKLFTDVDKDFNDIYQRAVEFRRKTEEMRKSNDRRNRYDENEQRREKSPAPVADKSKPNWIPIKMLNKDAEKEKERTKIRLDPAVKEKRDKAIDEIATRILDPHNFSGMPRLRVMEELKFSLYNIMIEMFKDNDVSYIELVIKFRARYDAKDEEKILLDVLASMPAHYKNSLKRTGDGNTGVPAKISRTTPAYQEKSRPKLSDSVNNYSSRSSARVKHESRKRGLGGRDDRALGKGSTLSKHPRLERPRVVRRSLRVSSPINREKKYQAASPNEYERAYSDTKTKVQLDDKPKVYEAKPIVYGEKALESIPKVREMKPKLPENKPETQEIKSKLQEAKPKVLKVQDEPEENVKDASHDEKPTSAERTKKRFNELSPLMTTMVEDELKNIMIKIWQTLPDNVPNEAEKLVLDKLKNDAGDDLRNTIGLNVTKRLLNVNNNPSHHKGLLIKIQMHSSVTDTETYEFSKKYGIGNFKYVQQRTYAGRMHSWADLDDLIAVKNLRCGKSHVTVTPVYNFMKCPPMLKTIFDGKQVYTSKENEKEVAKVMNKSEGKAIITADQVLAEDAKKAIAKNESIPKVKSTDKGEVKTEPKKTDLTKESPKNEARKPEDKNLTGTNSSQTNTAQKETIKQNEIKTETKITNRQPTEAVVSKAANSNVIKNETKVEPAKVCDKAQVPTNTAKKETVSPKVEQTKMKNPVTKPAKPDEGFLKTNDSAKKEIGKIEESKIEQTKVVSKEATKPAAKEPEKTATKEPTKPISKEPAKQVVKEIAKPVAKETAKPIIKETDKPNAKETDKPNAKETAKPIAKQQTKPITKGPTKPVTKEQNKPNAKPTAPAKEETVTKKSLIVAKTTPTKSTKLNAKNNEDDFDELDDRDILALLSGGIVLDECSGSDDD